MSPPPPRSHARQSGSARDAQIRDRSGSHSASNLMNGSFVHHENTSRDVTSSHRHLTEVGRHHGHQQEHPHYQEVTRAWRSRNRELDQVVEDPVLQEAIARLEGRNPSHGRSSSRHPGPTPNEQQYRQTRSPDSHEESSRRLGTSNLRDLNRDRPPTYATQRRTREEERAEPYDGVRYVSRRSDYEGRREEYRRYGLEEEYEQRRYDDGYGDHDDWSSGTLY